MGKPETTKPKDTIIAFKGFDRNFSCRGFVYEIGKTYTHDGDVSLCSAGFHACENPLDTFAYYIPGTSRYAIVEASGSIDRKEDGDTKIASARIHIKAEVSMPDFVAAAIEWVTSKCDPVKAKHSTGYQSASSATGYQSASSATGDRSASSATGDQSASSATGYQSASSATGKNSVAMSIGIHGRAKAGNGGAIVLCNHDAGYNIRHIRASKIGENGIKPDTFYILNNAGEFEESA